MKIKFFDGSLILNIFLCRRSILICEECFESNAEVIDEAVCHSKLIHVEVLSDS